MIRPPNPYLKSAKASGQAPSRAPLAPSRSSHFAASAQSPPLSSSSQTQYGEEPRGDREGREQNPKPHAPPHASSSSHSAYFAAPVSAQSPPQTIGTPNLYDHEPPPVPLRRLRESTLLPVSALQNPAHAHHPTTNEGYVNWGGDGDPSMPDVDQFVTPPMHSTMKIDELYPPVYRSVFGKITEFNAMQTQVFGAVALSDENCVVSAPTGSGKVRACVCVCEE